jgi:phosphate transport system permease protein
MKRSNGASSRRSWPDSLFSILCLGILTLVLVSIAVLLAFAFSEGISRIHWSFFTAPPSRIPEKAGILVPITGSICLVSLALAMAFPIGLAAAIFLEEYGPQRYGESRALRIIEANIANLAAVPSIVYGLLGLAFFVRYLALGQTLLAGALTLSLFVLPIIIITSREALRAVPSSLREASTALGATQWQTIYHEVLPAALPGVVVGTISALLRAVGETAPLILIGAVSYVAFVPENILSPYSALPVQIFSWVTQPNTDFHANAAAAITVLVPGLLLVNALTIWLRNRYEGRKG